MHILTIRQNEILILALAYLLANLDEFNEAMECNEFIPFTKEEVKELKDKSFEEFVQAD